MRIIFIHGLGETESCFNEIAVELPGEHVFVSLWESLGTKRRVGLKVLDFCQELVDAYQIKPTDVIIGHSTGGRLAYFIKHLNGNKIIQIASWTKDGKPRFPMVKNKQLIYLIIRSGLLFTKRGSKFMIDNYKRREDSKPFYIETIQNLKEGNRNCVVNQFKLALSPVNESITITPDLRIHAKRDNIVGYPDESFQEVPGDHFSLLTHPKEVLVPIKTILGIS